MDCNCHQNQDLEHFCECMVDHASEKAVYAREKYGPEVTVESLQAMFQDPRAVRFPVTLQFDAEPLHPGEFGTSLPVSESPQDGFSLTIHPHFQNNLKALPLLIAYHLVTVNYGEEATPDTAEVYASTLLGMDREEYYQQLCRLADQLV